MKKQIFVVDDEDSVLYTVKHGLEDFSTDLQVTALNSGRKCLQLLEQNQIPDLILLDIMMPEMNGWEIYNKIKQNNAWKQIPIVFLTARTDQVAKKAGQFYGEDYIEKPFKMPDLTERIRKVLFK